MPPPFIFNPLSQFLDLVNFNVAIYLQQKHNCIWMNSRRGDVVCKYRRTKIAQGQNNHVYSNKSI